MAIVPVEQQLRVALVAGATGGLVGSSVFLQLPQNPAYPCVRVVLVSQIPIYTQNHDSTQGTVSKARLQVDCYGDQSANSARVSEDVARAVKADLQTFNAWATDGSNLSSPNRVLNVRSAIEQELQPPVFRRILDIEVWTQDQ